MESATLVAGSFLFRALPVEGGHRALAPDRKEDGMSSIAISKQYLDPSDLAMLDRVLARANSKSMGAGSFRNRQIAAFLIYKFQAGVTEESDLLESVKSIAARYPNMKPPAVW